MQTIQAEQDEIIRAPHRGVLVVEGGPGTGKTAVALHRAAYLLYEHRELLAKRAVLIVGHSNTVPATVQALSGTTVPPIAETEYDRLYTVTLDAAGAHLEMTTYTP